MPLERLQKIIAAAGVASRRKAEELISSGQVQVNGTVVTELGSKADPETDHVRVNGKLLHGAQRHVYLLLNKPKGYVTTMSDPEKRPTVMDLIRGVKGRVYPIGRLDYASEGLLLLTNDSEWAARVTAPETHLHKTYHVQINAMADEALLQQMRNGIRASDDDFLCVKNVRVLRSGERNSWIEIVLDEGKNRHIRRMLNALKIEALRLVRVAIGPLALGDLPKTATRALKPEEKQALDRVMLRQTHESASLAR